MAKQENEEEHEAKTYIIYFLKAKFFIVHFVFLLDVKRSREWIFFLHSIRNRQIWVFPSNPNFVSLVFFLGAMAELWTKKFRMQKWTTKQLYRLRSKVEYVLVIVIIVVVLSSENFFAENFGKPKEWKRIFDSDYWVSISLFGINK